MLMTGEDGAIDSNAVFAPLAGFEKVGLAVSGGPDSLALMLLAARFAKSAANAPRFIVYSVDHGLRPEAGAETEMVAELARQYGFEARILRWEGVKPSSGVQAQARAARYRLIGEAMSRDGAEVLCTAHHRDDQAETFLMRLAHASGLAGLGGMRDRAEIEGVTVLRPLLGIPRGALARLVTQAGIFAVDDPSNQDRTYERVRWRQALSLLEPLGLSARRIGLFARRAQRAEDALAQIAYARFSALAEIDAFGVVRIGHGLWLNEIDEIAVRLVQMALKVAGDNKKPFLLSQAEELASALKDCNEFVPVTLAGARIALAGGAICFARETGRVLPQPAALEKGGQAKWDGRFLIRSDHNTVVTIVPGKALTRVQIAAFLGENDFKIKDMEMTPAIFSGSELVAFGTRSVEPNVVSRFTALSRIRAAKGADAVLCE